MYNLFNKIFNYQKTRKITIIIIAIMLVAVILVFVAPKFIEIIKFGAGIILSIYIIIKIESVQKK